MLQNGCVEVSIIRTCTQLRTSIAMTQVESQQARAATSSKSSADTLSASCCSVVTWFPRCMGCMQTRGARSMTGGSAC